MKNKTKYSFLFLFALIFTAVFQTLPEKKPSLVQKKVKEQTQKKFTTLSLMNKKGQAAQTQLPAAPSRQPANQVISYDNYVDKNWQDELVSKLTSEGLKAEIEIHSIEDEIVKANNKTLLMKKVVVQMKHSTLGTSTFRALVDPQSGSVVKTWDRSRFEDFTGKNKVQLVYQGQH